MDIIDTHGTTIFSLPLIVEHLILWLFWVIACSPVLGCFVCCIDGRDVTFLCGRAGVCALGAVLAKHAGDEQLLNYYLVQFREVF